MCQIGIVFSAGGAQRILVLLNWVSRMYMSRHWWTLFGLYFQLSLWLALAATKIDLCVSALCVRRAVMGLESACECTGLCVHAESTVMQAAHVTNVNQCQVTILSEIVFNSYTHDDLG